MPGSLGQLLSQALEQANYSGEPMKKQDCLTLCKLRVVIWHGDDGQHKTPESTRQA